MRKLRGEQMQEWTNNVAEDFDEGVLTGSPPPGRGRRPGITDGELSSNRDLLNGLIESGWGDLGPRLQKAKKSRDLGNVFQDWARYPNIRDRSVTKVLLALSDSGDCTGDLPTKRREHSSLVKSLRSVQDGIHQSRERLDAIERIGKVLPYLQMPDRRWLTAESLDRIEALDSVEEQHNVLRERLKVVEAKIPGSEMSFARSEILRFLDEQRYTLTPLSVANALAGLPMIGYRRSVNRCAKWKRCHGVPYEIFLTVKKLVGSCHNLNDLPALAESWIRGKRSRKLQLDDAYLRPKLAVRGSAIHELKRNWHDLKLAIQTALALKTTRAELAFRVFAGYVRNKENQGPLQAFLREQARIP